MKEKGKSKDCNICASILINLDNQEDLLLEDLTHLFQCLEINHECINPE